MKKYKSLARTSIGLFLTSGIIMMFIDYVYQAEDDVTLFGLWLTMMGFMVSIGAIATAVMAAVEYSMEL